MVEHWESQGHEVKKSLYYDPALARWADIVWFETCDHNLEVATVTGEAHWKLSEMDKKRIICRVIDIEAWCGLHRVVDWGQVDDVIFLAPHMRKLVEQDINFEEKGVRVNVIPCGVNLDKFNFTDRPQNKNIAWVAERWYAKGIDYFLQYAAMLYKKDPEYKIHAVGIWADNATGGWYKAYIDQFLQDNPMNVEFIEHVDNMSLFLEDMSYSICFSKKEAFSYASAEGMAKGCKPIIHAFYGAKDIWDSKYVWNTLDEAIEMTLGDFNRQEYRDYISKYSTTKMLESFDPAMKGEQ
jgi:glycosyltransferase involved in cell wall biosynthesis